MSVLSMEYAFGSSATVSYPTSSFTADDSGSVGLGRNSSGCLNSFGVNAAMPTVAFTEKSPCCAPGSVSFGRMDRRMMDLVSSRMRQ